MSAKKGAPGPSLNMSDIDSSKRIGRELSLATYYQFNLLSLNEKAQYTWEHGTYLATRKADVYKVNLYHLGKFFAEIFYNSNKNSIAHIKSFKSKMCLEPYLNRIEIDL